MPAWKLIAFLAGSWLVAIPVGGFVVHSLSADLPARIASAVGALIALVVYALCTTVAMRAAGNVAFGFPVVLVLGLLQLIAVVASGLAVINLAYWLFGG